MKMNLFFVWELSRFNWEWNVCINLHIKIESCCLYADRSQSFDLINKFMSVHNVGKVAYLLGEPSIEFAYIFFLIVFKNVWNVEKNNFQPFRSVCLDSITHNNSKTKICRSCAKIFVFPLRRTLILRQMKMIQNVSNLYLP